MRGGSGALETPLVVGLLVGVNFTTRPSRYPAAATSTQSDFASGAHQGKDCDLAYRLLASPRGRVLAQGCCGSFTRPHGDLHGCRIDVTDQLARGIRLVSAKGPRAQFCRTSSGEADKDM